MKSIAFVINVMILSGMLFGSVFGYAASGSHENLSNLLPVLLIICLTIVGTIGMARNLKTGQAFWWFTILGVLLPSVWWISTVWPSGGILKLFSL